MRFSLGPRTMDIGTFEFNFLRTLMESAAGAADSGECALVGSRIKRGDSESWVREWRALAERVHGSAERALRVGQLVTARDAFFRASNYYRTALFSTRFTDSRYDVLLTQMRECCRAGGRLSTPPIEVLDIPFGSGHLPGYFMSAGRPKSPTLLVINGGDTANEEMVHWLGFACVERGWNFAVFEGPGQWSALQMNPELHMRPDFEVPTSAVIDHLFQREDVDQDRLAAYGPSLGSLLVTRVAAHEQRIRAFCADGLIVDVYQAWMAVLPRLVKMMPSGVFDSLFSAYASVSPQTQDVVTHLRAMIGDDTTTPTGLLTAWKPFNVVDLASKITCPMLVLYGEAEAAQTDVSTTLAALDFILKVRAPISVRMFSYEDGWAASHCHVGGLAALQSVLFDWLEDTMAKPDRSPGREIDSKVFDVVAKHVRGGKNGAALEALRRGARAA